MLKLVAAPGNTCIALGEAAAAVQSPSSTAHRILEALVAENLIEQIEADHHNKVGPLTHEFTLATAKDR